MAVFTELTGDIFKSDAAALVNPVNCAGVMGAGLAKQFKQHYPGNYNAYRLACTRNIVRPGKMFVYRFQESPARYLLNFPTKRHWTNPSELPDIESGLDDLVNVMSDFLIGSVAVPPLGAGLGGLNWQDVRELIYAKLEPVENLQVSLYLPR